MMMRKKRLWNEGSKRHSETDFTMHKDIKMIYHELDGEHYGRLDDHKKSEI